MATVERISYAPVKGLALVQPSEVMLESTGVRDNRRFYLIADDGRLVNGKLAGTLVQIRAEADLDGTTLTFQLGDGRTISGPVTLGEAVTTNFYRRRVAGHVVDGAYAEAVSDLAGFPVRVVRADEPGDGSDRGPRAAVSIVSVAGLERLAAEAGTDSVDDRRFRMLFTVDGTTANEEDGWVGREVRIGDAVIRGRGLVGRCAITTHDPDSGIPTLETLHVLGAYRGDIPTEEPLPFGIYGEVVSPGRVRVGDAVTAL